MVAWRASASCEPTSIKPERESLDEANFRANDLLYRIVDTCASAEYRIFISGDRNFRKLIYPEYKANRARVRRPDYLDAIRELLVREWNAEICIGYEADDGIGMAHGPDTIVVSNDKDFRQLGGELYNPVRNEFEVVDDQTAALSFYCQMLEGDTSDNVRGIDGIGPVKARRQLLGLSTEEMHHRVSQLYGDPRRFILNFRLLRILRSPEEYNELMAEIELETTVGEGERPEPTEDSSQEDSGNLSGANVE